MSNTNRRCVLLAVLGILASLPVFPLDVVEWAKIYQQPILAGAGVDAAGKTYVSGHLELRFQNGKIYPVMGGDQLLGFFFTGQGTFRYTAEKYEMSSFRTNLDRNLDGKVGSDGIFSSQLEKVLLYTSGGLDKLAGGSPWREGTTPADAQQAFASHQERFAEDLVPSSKTFMALAQTEKPSRPMVYALFTGKIGDFFYSLDSVSGGNEELSCLKKSKSDISYLKKERYAELLSSQPVGRQRLEPPLRRFLLAALDVELVNPGELTLQAEVTETVQILQPLQTLDYDLWSNLVFTVGAGGKYVSRDYTLEGAALPDGTKLPFVHCDHNLVVELPRLFQAGESVKLKFKLRGDILYHPNNDNYWELGTRPWYPMPRIDMQAYTYHAVCKVKKPFTAFSCGQVIRRWEEGDLACAEFREDKAIQVAVVLAGVYKTYAESLNGVTVTVGTYAMANPIATKQLARMMLGLIEIYKPLLGDYPFKELSVLQINSYGFGKAPAGIIFITSEAFTPENDTLSSIFSIGINQRLAHELAHQWWAHVAKLGQPEDAWLSESVAEYYGAFAIGCRKKDEFDKQMARWRSNAKPVKDKASVYVAHFLSGEKSLDDYYRLVYAKGPLMLHELRRQVGDNTFFTILKSYLRNFAGKPMETRNFMTIAKVVTQKDMGAFFDKYLFGLEWPGE